jgi:hypothetical protein
LVVGPGTCINGLYAEDVKNSEGDSTVLEQDDESALPGFGFVLLLTSMLIALIRQDSFRN